MIFSLFPINIFISKFKLYLCLHYVWVTCVWVCAHSHRWVTVSLHTQPTCWRTNCRRQSVLHSFPYGTRRSDLGPEAWQKVLSNSAILLVAQSYTLTDIWKCLWSVLLKELFLRINLGKELGLLPNPTSREFHRGAYIITRSQHAINTSLWIMRVSGVDVKVLWN